MITIKVYVTEADHEAIKRAAEAERRSLSSYVAVAAAERAKAVRDDKAGRGAK